MNCAHATVVTISASYGANGDQIANRVAERLGLPFVDRAIPASVVQQLTPSGEVEESLDEPAPRRWERIIMGFANATTPMGPNQLLTAEIETPERFRKANEAKLRDIADTTGGVILGRAGMAVLGGRTDVLCVRLDGPVEARIANAIAQGVDEACARKDQRVVDRARDAYAASLLQCPTGRSAPLPPHPGQHRACRWKRMSTSSSAPPRIASARRPDIVTPPGQFAAGRIYPRCRAACTHRSSTSRTWH